MTVGFGFLLVLIAVIVFGGLMLLLEDYDLIMVLLMLIDVVVTIFTLIVLVFWIYAMVSQNINPFEALGYVMWE